MNENTQHIYTQICKAVETDQIKLPTLPEVALKVKQAVESEHQTANDIAELLTQDSALSARLLQLANSPLYRSRNKIDNLQMAITRLGLRIVKDLVVMLAIKQAFQPSNPQLDDTFRQAWQTSVDVAAACRVLAQSHAELNAEQAVVAGLIHNIGSLPVIELADRMPEMFDQLDMATVIAELQNPVGEKILAFWGFPDSLVQVAAHWGEFDRTHTGGTDYVDLVQVAFLHTEHPPYNTPQDWSKIPAIGQLGLDPDTLRFDETAQTQLEETRASLMQI